MRISMEDVTVDFGNPEVRVLEGVSLTVGEGEHVALLGPSGSGKTTLLRLMLGAVRPSAGSCRVGGFDPFGPAEEVSRLRRRTGCIRQRDDLVTGLTARTNALMATTPDWKLGDWLSLLRGKVPRSYQAPLMALARHHGVERHLDARVEKLSGGQRQRIALVRALLHGPSLLLADEPTSGLDPRNGALVIDGVLESSRTLVLATHDLSVAARFPRVVALRDGRVVHDGAAPGKGTLDKIYAPEEEPACV